MIGIPDSVATRANNILCPRFATSAALKTHSGNIPRAGSQGEVAEMAGFNCRLAPSYGSRPYSSTIPVVGCVGFIAELKVLETFRSETSMLTRLNNSCIVGLEFSGEIVVGKSTDGTVRTLPCIAMPYVRGVALSEIITREKAWDLQSSFLQVLKAARDLALALACIHDRRTCHRDLSWNNVLISEGRHPVIIDLGNVALPEDAPAPQIQETVTGRMNVRFVPYTPGFVAPEHHDGTTVIDGRGDQFSLGVLLYLWFSGKKNKEVQWPFDRETGVSNNPGNTQEPVPLKTLRTGFISGWKEPLKTSFEKLSDVIQRMTAWHRDDRFQSMRDVAAAIEIILQECGDSIVSLPDELELKVDDSFSDLCGQVSLPADDAAGCLILQTLVRQSRQQIGEAINKIWFSLFETWNDSDLEPSKKSTRMLEEGRRMESDLKVSLNTVLRTFQKTKLTAAHSARFGGRFQKILGQTSATMILTRPPASGNEIALREHVNKQWDYFNQRQERLAQADYLLSLYSLQLNTLRSRQKKESDLPGTG